MFMQHGNDLHVVKAGVVDVDLKAGVVRTAMLATPTSQTLCVIRCLHYVTCCLPIVHGSCEGKDNNNTNNCKKNMHVQIIIMS